MKNLSSIDFIYIKDNIFINDKDNINSTYKNRLNNCNTDIYKCEVINNIYRNFCR